MKSIDILLIEDNPGDVELTKQSFECGRVKNSLKVIMDGEEALDYLFQLPPYENATLPDLILLDLNLPKVSGREILNKIKDDHVRKSIPVVILSSSEAAKDIQESYKLHANCFVSKPVELHDFIRVIQSIENFWIQIVKLPTP